MTITKAEWRDIEKELSKLNGQVLFKLGEHEITVEKVVTETKNFLVVWFDGSFKNDWQNPAIPGCPEVITKVWKKYTKAHYSSSFKESVETLYGKRAANKKFLDLNESCVRYSPNFSKASVLVRQYKKIEGLELILIGK